MTKAIKELKMEIEAIKKTQTERILEKRAEEYKQELQIQASPKEYKRWKKESQALKI